MTKNVTTEEHPHYAAFNKMVIDMCVLQVQHGVAFTNQEVSSDLTRLALEHYDVMSEMSVATIAAIIATLAVRDMPMDVRTSIEAGQSYGTH